VRERKYVSESASAKENERKWNLHSLVTMDTDPLSREVSNKMHFSYPAFINLLSIIYYHPKIFINRVVRYYLISE
jgi:hypothetical protein